MNDSPRRIYGLMAEFASPESLLAAARQTRGAGYAQIDAFTPFPVEGLSDAIGFGPVRLPWVVLAGGCIGGIGGFFLQYYACAVDYPINVGGRPFASWPAFGVVAFELTILAAALAAVLGMLILNKLPMPYHPAFNVAQFELASRNRFFLLVDAADAHFDRAATAQFLRGLGAAEVHVVEP